MPAAAEPANAAISKSVSISDFTSGGDWHVDEVKNVNVNIGSMDIDQAYTIRISLAKGMKFSSYIWNDTWGKPGTGVVGAKAKMSDQFIGYLSDNSISVDAQGTTTLEYVVAEETRDVNFSGQIHVEPDERYVYNNDEIENAITVTVLRGNSVMGNPDKFNVKATGNQINLRQYNEKTVYAGKNNQLLMELWLCGHHGGISYQNPAPAGDVVELTIPLNPSVTQVTNVTSLEAAWSMEDASYELQGNVLKIHNIKKVSDSFRKLKLNIYGNVSATAATGRSQASNIMTAKFTAYDGKEIDTSNADVREGNGNRNFFIVDQPSDEMIVSYLQSTASNTDTLNSPQAPDGNPTMKGFNLQFAATNNLGPQTISYNFPADVYNITRVNFPTDPATPSIKITKVTFDDGVERNVNIVCEKTSKTDKYRPVDVPYLRSLSPSDVPNNVRFIRSITAECGSFADGYGDWKASVPLGYWTDAVAARTTAADYSYTMTVTGNKTTNYAIPTKYYPSEYVSVCTNVRTINGVAGDASIEAGETATVRFRLATGQWNASAVKEPCAYVVVPKGMSLNPKNIKVDYRRMKADGTYETVDASAKLKYKAFTVKTQDNSEERDAYVIWATDTVVSFYKENPSAQVQRTAEEWVDFHVPLEADPTLDSTSITLSNYFFGGKGDPETGLAKMCSVYWNGESITGTYTWGIGTQLRKDSSGRKITINRNDNVTVSGYLAQTGGEGRVAPYDPGEDGSSNVNSVAFSTGSTGEYHVVVDNTVKTDVKKAEVKAFVPIPSAKISGSTVTSNNTCGVKTANLPSKYQFSPYTWPMTLSGSVRMPAGADANFQVKYWLNECALGENNMPREVSGKTVIKTQRQMTEADYAKVILVEISSDEVPKNSSTDFVLPIKIGVTADAAMQAGLNDKKNIFRSWFYRSSDGGSGYLNSNYVAARLTVAQISGIAFEDVDTNSLYEQNKGDKLLRNITVKLLQKKGAEWVAKGTTTTDANGKYLFKDLEDGNYRVEFTNPQTGTYHFAKAVADTQSNYTKNADATANSAHTTGTSEINLPTQGGIQGRQLNINAGFVKKITVKIVNTDTKKGTIAGSSQQNVSSHVIWPGQKLTAPATKATGSNQFDRWMVGNKDFSFNNPIEQACTINGVWKSVVKFVASQGGSVGTEHATQYIARGATVAGVPEPKGDDTHNFIGWQSKSGILTTNLVKTTAITEDTTFTALFSEKGKATVILNYNGGKDSAGEASKSLTGTAGSTITGLPNTSDIKRKGWRLNTANLWSPALPQKFTGENSTNTHWLQWIAKKYKVEYDVSGGTSIDPKEDVLFADDNLTEGIEAKKAGYTFEGWFTDEERTKPYSDDLTYGQVAGDDDEKESVTLYAKFQAKDYTVAYEVDGGTKIDDRIVKWDDSSLAPDKNPEKTGYTFDGWYIDQELTKPYTADVKYSDLAADEEVSRVVLYAKYNINSYTINFDTAGGSIIAPITLPYGSAVTAPADPTRTGYIFDGWDKAVPATMPAENMTIKANWKVAPDDSDDTDPKKSFAGNTEKQIDEKLNKLTSDADVAGSTFSLLQFRGIDKGKKKIKLSWKKPKKVKKYIVYGAKCGKTKGKLNKYKKIKTLTAGKKTFNVTKMKKEKLKKGTSYKFIIVAFDKNGKSLAVSKTLHIRTSGGKYGNFRKSVFTKPKNKKKLSIKVKKTYKLKAKGVRGKKKVTVHRKMKYESSNPKVATVGASSGKIKAKKKGTTIIYAYSQSGQFAKMKVTVK